MATRIEFHKHGGPEVLQAVEFTPADPAENEIQVENKAIGINFIDTYIRSGLLPAAITTQRIRYRSGRHRE
ncbi:quinone oxidoreductase, NADPH-dependent [Escherichia coli]|uniref:Quinone oxidoreductase, NADPH-dependent n=1 Tax=Escherichia coli TaxID=562 RepID=A0A2X3M799_ECOLX|nr:quinone oxidoreductase, NADPH-dependent [Escherichia coli]